MSGRAKRTLYRVFSVAFFLCALGGTVALFSVSYLRFNPKGSPEKWQSVAAGSVALFSILFFPIEVALHEFGHTVCGLLAGFRFVSASVNGFSFGRGGVSYRFRRDFAGRTQMLPKSAKGLRGRAAFFTLGGALINLVYGGVFLALYFTFPVTPALLFFELLAPLNLYEGIVALIPCELSAGRTDGKTVAELVCGTPYAKVFLAVMAAQGVLVKETYAAIPRESLFDLPVIREDEPASLALAQLRWQYLFFVGEEDEAAAELRRLKEICDICEVPDEIACDLRYGERVFEGREGTGEGEEIRGNRLPALRTRYALTGEGKEEAIRTARKEKFVGIRALELKLIERAEEQK